MSHPSTHRLPYGYRARTKPAYWTDDTPSVTWQPDVYPAAARLASALGAGTIVDIGCGAAGKLAALAQDFQAVGVDYGSNLEAARAAVPSGTFFEHDLDGPGQLPVAPATLDGAVVVCADVIEHLRRPERLLAKLRGALEHAKALVLSTPDRELSHGGDHLGPPPHGAHTREWARRELEALLAEHGFHHGVTGLTRTNDADDAYKTIVAVFVREGSDLDRASEAVGWRRPQLPERLQDQVGCPYVPMTDPGRVAKRVCFISREYFEDTQLGGIGRVVSMQAAALAAAGADVHVITLAAGRKSEEFHRGGIAFHRIPQPAIAAHAQGDVTYQARVVWALAAAEEYKRVDEASWFDVVEVPDFYSEGLHLELRPETALVVGLHSLTEIIARTQFEGEQDPGALAAHALELAVVRRADLLYAPTQLVLDDTRELLGRNQPPAVVLPYALDADRFPERPAPVALPAVLRLAFVGRVERRKGPDLALRAAAALSRRGREVQLVVAGRNIGRYREDVLEPLAAELGFGGLTFLDEVGEATVSALLTNSDCALMPSRWDNFHTAAVEALGTGLPVITSDADGLACWFGAEDGLLALSIGDPEAFAERAADALSDERWMLESGARGAARARELLAGDRVAADVLARYDELLATHRGTAAVVAEADLRRDGERRARAVARAQEEVRALETRGRTVLAWAEELLERPDLLGAYGATIRGTDDVTLVAVTDARADQVGPQLLTLLEDLGLAGEDGPDVLLHAGARDGGVTLDQRAAAILSERTELPEPLQALTRTGIDGARGLARLASRR